MSVKTTMNMAFQRNLRRCKGPVSDTKPKAPKYPENYRTPPDDVPVAARPGRPPENHSRRGRRSGDNAWHSPPSGWRVAGQCRGNEGASDARSVRVHRK